MCIGGSNSTTNENPYPGTDHVLPFRQANVGPQKDGPYHHDRMRDARVILIEEKYKDKSQRDAGSLAS